MVEVDDLSERLLREAAGDDIFRLRSDAVKAAHALQLAATGAETTERGGFGARLSIATVLGLLAGLLLALVLLRTVWAPQYACHGHAGGSFTCVRAGR